MSLSTAQSSPETGHPPPGSGEDPGWAPPRSMPRTATVVQAVKAGFKGLGLALGLAVVALPALTCRAERRFSGRDEFFLFWGQAFALAPGLPGKYLRKCFYFLTLQSCSLECDLGLLSYFSDRRCEIGRGVYVGFGASIGLASLGVGCLIGDRASVINGGWQHTLGPDGRLTPFDPSSARRVRIGEETWIGEGAIVMADVGSGCIIGAGSVVSVPVPDGCLVAGNPARFVRRLVAEAPPPPESRPDGPPP